VSERVAESLALNVVIHVDQPPVIALRCAVPLDAVGRAVAALTYLVLAAAVVAAA